MIERYKVFLSKVWFYKLYRCAIVVKRYGVDFLFSRATNIIFQLCNTIGINQNKFLLFLKLSIKIHGINKHDEYIWIQLIKKK
jgi:hypothetical protein